MDIDWFWIRYSKYCKLATSGIISLSVVNTMSLESIKNIKYQNIGHQYLSAEYWIFYLKWILINFEYDIQNVASWNSFSVSGEYNEARVKGSAICNLNYNQPHNTIQIRWKYKYNLNTTTHKIKYKEYTTH